MNQNDTRTHRPMPSRPGTGWQAWAATIGYLATHHNPDATLMLQAAPSSGATIGWEATLTWGTSREHVKECISLEMALQDLWAVTYPGHLLFHEPDVLARAPSNYSDDRWITPAIRMTLDRILKVTWNIYETDWRLVIVYRPVERPEDRVQARLMADDDMTLVGGKGATLLDACRMLFHRSARAYTLKRDS